MNGTRPKFMENQIPAQSYFEQPDPYVNAPSCHVNLLELSRYAKRCGKKLVELTQEEVKKFSIQGSSGNRGGHRPPAHPQPVHGGNREVRFCEFDRCEDCGCKN